MIKISFLFSLLFSCTIAISQNQWKDIYSESAWWERDKWQKPDEIIRQLNIKKGSEVADVGCHEGYMTFKLSNAVGDTGKVYAVDVSPIKVEKIKASIEMRDIHNVLVIQGDDDNPNLPLNKLDAVIILDTYHEMYDHDKILQHIKAALKPGGRLILCEPISKERRDLARADQEAKHELGINFAIADLEKNGFKIITKQDPFADREKIKGDKMWLIVAVK